MDNEKIKKSSSPVSLFDKFFSFVAWAMLGTGLSFIIVFGLAALAGDGNTIMLLLFAAPLGFLLGGLIGVYKVVNKPEKPDN